MYVACPQGYIKLRLPINVPLVSLVQSMYCICVAQFLNFSLFLSWSLPTSLVSTQVLMWSPIDNWPNYLQLWELLLLIRYWQHTELLLPELTYGVATGSTPVNMRKLTPVSSTHFLRRTRSWVSAVDAELLTGIFWAFGMKWLMRYRKIFCGKQHPNFQVLEKLQSFF